MFNVTITPVSPIYTVYIYLWPIKYSENQVHFNQQQKAIAAVCGIAKPNE